MATIRDVAQEAGVSVATVSNYLNHTKPVKKETARRIQQAIDTLKYSQNLSARSLKSNHYPDVGVILPNFDDPYYVQLFQGIESAFQNSGYFVNLAFSYDIPDLEQTILRGLLQKQICGLILLSSQPDNLSFYQDHFSGPLRPLVLIDRDIADLEANYVSFDTRSMIEQVTTHLLERGFHHLLLVSGPERFTCEANAIDGFQRGLAQKGLQASVSSVLTKTALPLASSVAGILQTNLSRDDAFRKTAQLLQREKPDAIVTTSESLASGVIESLLLHGYSPQDIPVVSLGEEHWNYHTHSFASHSIPRPAIRLGQTAAELLLGQLEKAPPGEAQRILLTVEPTSIFSAEPIGPFSKRKPLYSTPSGEISFSQQGFREESARKPLRILLVDTPQVHAFLGLIKDFENQYGITTEIKILPHHHYYETLLDKHASSRDIPFDVFMYDIPWLSSLALGHILKDITKEVNRMDLSIFLPDCLKYFSAVQGHYYGIPFMYAPQILYYRKDLFENTELKNQYERYNNLTLRPPRTMKEFNTVADFFTNQTKAIPYGLSIPAAYNECLAPEIYMRLRACGGRLFTAKGDIDLDERSAQKAYESFLQSIQAAKPNYRTATDVSIVEDFLRGDTAMLITYPSFLTDVVDLKKSSMIGSIGYYHIPGRSPLLGGWSLGISSLSQATDEAMAFLRWTCQQKTATYFALLGGQTAITSTYTNDELVKLYPWLPLYYSTYPYTRPVVPPLLHQGSIVSQSDIDSIVCRHLYRLMDGQEEIKETIANTKAGLELLLEGTKHADFL